ncbi:ATP-binding protein [Streptomyces sp. NPDC002730]|uniref:ATP-binding protein n=1 Tax=Streptomyces sp. NPDC002730 TaxID=3364662 RepID=UPI003694A4E3
MPPFLRSALCPVAATDRPTVPGGLPPAPGLALSLTVPGEPCSAAIVRTAMASALHVHGLDRYTPPATLAVTELMATATKLTPSRDLYLSLRHRDDVLRLVVWDQHPQHTDPDAVTLCDERRRRALWLLTAVVDDWGGEWGVCDALPPHHGTKSWVVLPR